MADRKQPRYNQKKRAALEAAAAVFAEHGYHGASTTAIAERLGIKQGSLYYYFKSKQQALEEVCAYGIEDYVSRIDGIAAMALPFAVRLLAVFQSHLSAFRERRDAMKVYNDERLYLPESARTELHARGSGYRKTLEALFARAVEKGELRADLDSHFAALTVIGIGNAWGDLIVRDDTLDTTVLAQQCADLILRGVVQAVA
ncbi:MAG: TetR/AcrR family transcriptional regulator [Pseudomonadota bacterium]